MPSRHKSIKYPGGLMRHRKILARSAVVAGAFGLTIAGAGQAQALAYDGTDPSATGCSSSSRTVASAPLKNRVTGSTVATIELRFSSSCKTAWARLTLVSGSQWDCGDPAAGYACSKAKIVRNNDGRTYNCTIYEGQTQCYTPQVYDYDPNTSYAQGELDLVTGGVVVRTASY
ncbi:DUF2690 domain-containing protein [Streptomyces hebeiensis]